MVKPTVPSLGFALDPRSDDPLRRQVFDQVVARIASGTLPAGFRLPPTRALARELDIHRNTVVRAYEDLEGAGFVISTVGRGTFVAEVKSTGQTAATPSRRSLPWDSLLSRASNVEPLGRVDRMGRIARGPNDPIHLARLQPSPDLLPDALFKRCLDHVFRTQGSKALEYAPRDGLPRLRGLIAEDLARQGVPASAEDVLVTSGSQQALDLIARTLLDPGDTFLVDDSTYSGAINLLATAGARLVGIPADDEGPDLEALDRAARAGAKGLYLMPNTNNPTATTISRARREAIVEWSHDRGVPIVEDDYAGDLHLDGVPPPAAMRALSGDVLFVGSFSKKLIPALRVGFVLCPRELRPRIDALKHSMDLCTSGILQAALAEFIERGYLTAHLGRVIPEYRDRRDALCRSLERHMPEGVTWKAPQHGLHLWLRLPPSLDPDRFHDEALQRGVVVNPGAFHTPNNTRRSGVRLTFCSEPTDRLVLAGRRLGQAAHAALGLSKVEPADIT